MPRKVFESKAQLETIEQSKVVKRVIDQLKSASTRGQYITYLNRFVNDFLGKSLSINQLVNEARRDVSKTQQRIDKFYEWLQKEMKLKESSSYIIAYGYVRGLFANLDVHFQRQWSKQHAKAEHTKEAIKLDNVYEFFPLDENSRTIHFNRQLMQDFLSNLKLRDQAITLALLSSSQDSGDLLALNVGDIRQTNHRIFWEGRRGKTDILFRTFFSGEATRLIRRYLDLERRGAGDDEPLFTYTTRPEGQNGVKGARMTTGDLSQIYRTAARKMGIQWKEGDQSPLRPKRMRHLFRTACDLAGIDELYKNAFMGHKNSMGQSYSEMPKAKLELEYLRVEPFITVYGEVEESLQTKEEVAKLKTTIDVLNSRLSEQQKTLDELQKFMETRIEQVTTKLWEEWMREQEETDRQSIEEEQKWREDFERRLREGVPPPGDVVITKGKELFSSDKTESDSKKEEPKEQPKKQEPLFKRLTPKAQ